MKFDFKKYMVYLIFAFVLALFAIWLGWSFFSVRNLLNITRQTAMISIMAVGMTFVIACGEIDLSIGSIVAICSLVCALVLRETGNAPLAVVITLALGSLIGLLNGLNVTQLAIPSCLATLGMLSIGKGFAMWTTETRAVPITNDTFNFLFGMGALGNFPILFLWTLLVLVAGHFILRYMPFGKRVLATGGNAVSASYSGVNVTRVKIKVMIMNGFLAAFAAMLYSGRMQTARYTFGDGDELSAIAAVVLGGTSMSGGTGSIIGAVIGSLLLGIINNGLIIGGLSVSQQMIVRGLIIILAVALGNIGNKRKLRN
ncbi:MAG: ABC transporter permease [Planctomycetota bacterium]|jgi:ribose transport system permease protein|nr:ABC transporter permease [Planctomycetota bacterium]